MTADPKADLRQLLIDTADNVDDLLERDDSPGEPDLAPIFLRLIADALDEFPGSRRSSTTDASPRR
jgi:hypothetical protein